MVREASCRDAVPHADLLAIEPMEDDGGRVDLIDMGDADRDVLGLVDNFGLVDNADIVAAFLDCGRIADRYRDADRLNAEELVLGEHGGHHERQVVRRQASAHDFAVGVGQGCVALDVRVLVDRRHERDQKAVAEEQDQ
eukprot:CAMPEP_0119056932 /NCGR_PEP_ID=MMETSP1178-20130426/1493_1 /TAXON_ID=33656 /ORGANISM="unid sp, Strain CCMP2000" /LENGTH=138 /DNA_ID=CAMNT_0007037715 /DNA_START=245 /DNA_END=661 /DNA_ORIENTATION=-